MSRNLYGYYCNFDPTGVDAIDAILEAISAAGKAYHNTSAWQDPLDHDYRCIKAGESPIEAIQRAANEAARRWHA